MDKKDRSRLKVSLLDEGILQFKDTFDFKSLPSKVYLLEINGRRLRFSRYITLIQSLIEKVNPRVLMISNVSFDRLPGENDHLNGLSPVKSIDVLRFFNCRDVVFCMEKLIDMRKLDVNENAICNVRTLDIHNCFGKTRFEYANSHRQEIIGFLDWAPSSLENVNILIDNITYSKTKIDSKNDSLIMNALKANIQRTVNCRSAIFTLMCCWRYSFRCCSSIDDAGVSFEGNETHIGCLPMEIMMIVALNIYGSRYSQLWETSDDDNLSLARKFDVIMDKRSKHVKSMSVIFGSGGFPKKIVPLNILKSRKKIDKILVTSDIPSKMFHDGHIMKTLATCSFSMTKHLTLCNMDFQFDVADTKALYPNRHDARFLRGNSKSMFLESKDSNIPLIHLETIFLIDCLNAGNFIELLSYVFNVNYGNENSSVVDHRKYINEQAKSESIEIKIDYQIRSIEISNL